MATYTNNMEPGPIPEKSGIGLRAPHYQAMMDTPPAVGFVEIHSENYFGRGGKPHHYLEHISQDYPISFHGVGLSLGSTDPLNPDHIKRLRELIDQYQPILISEHLSWGSINNLYLNDLLPLPYTEESLKLMVDKVAEMQDRLARQCLIENISSYLEYTESTIPEQEFIVALSQRSGCGILLDVNNVYVNSQNHNFDPYQFINDIPPHLVKEYHLAGHVKNTFAGGHILIDSHNRPVAKDVWNLFEHAVNVVGQHPTLIEWDSELPSLSTLVNEAHQADGYLSGASNAKSTMVANKIC